MGWKIDDIVRAEAGKHAKQFECSICFSIWHEPVETQCCENTFCKDCITRCAACPICRIPLGPVKQCSKALLRMLNNVDVRCPHSVVSEIAAAASDFAKIEAKSEEGSKSSAIESSAKRARMSTSVIPACTWQGTYGDLLSKHLGECPLHPVICPRDCGEKLLRMDLARHELTCPKSFEKCSICGELVKPADLPNHRREAAELHVQLLEERLEEERERADRKIADGATLDQVFEKVKNLPKTQQQHVTMITRQRAEDIKQEVKRQLNKKVKWEIAGAGRLREKKPRGQSLSSPRINLCGYSFCIVFYPNGYKDSDKGCSAISLSGDCDRAMSIQYTFNGTLSETDVDWKDSSGFVGWPKTKEIFDGCTDDLMTVEVEVLSIADVVRSTVAP